MEASKEELEKIGEVQQLLNEYLANNGDRLSPPIRRAISSYSADEEFLLKYVKGRKLDVEKAFRSIVYFADIRVNKYPELFPEQIPELVLHTIREGVLTPFKNQDSLGRTAIWLKASKWDVSKISLEDIICTGRFIIHELMSRPGFLTKGTVLLIDCEGATLSHARQFTVSNIIKFVNVFWQAYPIQIKGLYNVNAPWFVRPVFNVVKPFLPAKLRNRVLITSGVTELHDQIEPDVLPECLGGVLSDEEAASMSFLQPTEDRE